ncbi:MAG: hypothetical protein IT304_02960 [Dehalococcoidia bacterium]|nr:hypothetical protein [Dehalococcoidia bacterium]
MDESLRVVGSPFAALGGREGVARVVDDFYRRVEADAPLRAVYPEDLTPGREKLKLFFEQWLGGPPVYSERHGDPRLRQRHLPFAIDEGAAERWLLHMGEALAANGVPADFRAALLARLAPLARHMVNMRAVPE